MDRHLHSDEWSDDEFVYSTPEIVVQKEKLSDELLVSADDQGVSGTNKWAVVYLQLFDDSKEWSKDATKWSTLNESASFSTSRVNHNIILWFQSERFFSFECLIYVHYNSCWLNLKVSNNASRFLAGSVNFTTFVCSVELPFDILNNNDGTSCRTRNQFVYLAFANPTVWSR